MSASALALKAIAGPQVALGRAGDGPRAFPGWEAASVAPCGARGGDLRAADSPAPTPPGLQVPEVRLGGVGVLKSVKFTELCSFDSESSEKKILLIEYVFILRSTNVTDRRGSVYLPLNAHGPYYPAGAFSSQREAVH